MNKAQAQLHAALARLWKRGHRIVSAQRVAEELWPDGRTKNVRGQVFHLGAGTAGRLLLRSPLVFEVRWRRYQIVPERLPEVADDPDRDR